MAKVRIQLAGRFSPISANLSPRNRINPHATATSSILPIASKTNPSLQIDRHRNKSTEKGVEKKRHRHEYHDVDQITPSTRSASSFRSLNLAFRHSPRSNHFGKRPEDKSDPLERSLDDDSSHVASLMKLLGNHRRQSRQTHIAATAPAACEFKYLVARSG